MALRNFKVLEFIHEEDFHFNNDEILEIGVEVTENVQKVQQDINYQLIELIIIHNKLVFAKFKLPLLLKNFTAFASDVQNDEEYVDLEAFYKSSEYINYHNNYHGEKPIHIASGLGRVDVVRQLLKTGVSINTKIDNGWTPVFFATLEGHADLVQFLCSKNARIDIKTKNKQTVLDLAQEYKRTEIINILKNHAPKNKIKEFFKVLFKK